LALLAVAMVLVGAGRITSTYPVFSYTYDEPAHIAAGMEWLDRGSYTYEPMHPPLARVAVALGPWLSGLHSVGLADLWDEGDAILHATGAYAEPLTLARLGVLPFFLLAAALVWVWGRQLFGAGVALAATTLFTTLPPVLAHSGLATTDMAITATLPLAMYAFTMWLKQPSFGRSLALGAALAGAVLSKLSALVLLPPCMIVVFGWRWASTEHRNGRVAGGIRAGHAGPWIPSLRPFAAVACVAMLVLWVGYRCSLVAATTAAARPHVSVDLAVGPSGALLDAIYAAAEAPILPFSELARGIAQLAEHNADGHRAYLLGRTSQTGWWWFFPAALLVKTPIAFLLLAALGCVASLKEAWRTGRWETAVPSLCAMAILVAVLPSRIAIGLRHVLPTYPFLALAAGFGLARLARCGRTGTAGRMMAALLLAWHLASGAVAHPDYLAYFNEFAGSHPDLVLVDSDLDWGQDLRRLGDTLRKLGGTEVAVSLHGHSAESELDTELMRDDLPAVRPFNSDQPPRGWVAVSLYLLREDPRYSWLNECRPVATVGKSIHLYRFAEDGASLPPEVTANGTEHRLWSRCRH
jgi:hypothetical protein